ILAQIVDVLDAYRNPQQVRRRAEVRRLDGLAMLERGVHTTETCRAADEFEPRGQLESLRATALHLDREQSAEAAFHLADSDVVAGIRRQPRIECTLDLWMLAEICRDCERVRGLLPDAQVQRLQAALQ